MCPDITEEEYGDVCDYLESLLPNTKGIIAWRLRYGKLAEAPKRFSQEFGLFLIPRLTFKTSLIAALCVFAYLIDPGIRITLGRASTMDSESTLSGIKDHIEGNQIIAQAFGEQRERFRVWATVQIVSMDRPPGTREATIDTTGLNSSKTGFHPDMVILDDLVNETNYESSSEMERAWKKIQAFIPIIERWGTMIVQGTRWGEYDVYGKIIARDEQLVREGKPPRFRKYICGAYRDDGQPRFPTPLPDYRIAQLREDIDPKLFAAWILNRARAEGEDIFTSAYIQYVDAEYVGGPYGELHLHDTSVNAPLRNRFGPRVPMATYMYIDPAPTVDPPGRPHNRKRDYTGVVIVGFDEEANYWALYADELKQMPTDRLRTILWLAQTYEPRKIRLENADLDGVLLQLELDRLGIQSKVERFNPKADRRHITMDPKLAPKGFTKKAAQIEAMEPILKGRRAYFVRGMTGPLVRQLIDYPQVQHDDVLDAYSMSRIDEHQARQTLVIDIDTYGLESERKAWQSGRANPQTALQDLEQAAVRRNPGETPQRAAGQWAGPMTPVRANLHLTTKPPPK
jgi:hypothetical protein